MPVWRRPHTLPEMSCRVQWELLAAYPAEAVTRGSRFALAIAHRLSQAASDREEITALRLHLWLINQWNLGTFEVPPIFQVLSPHSGPQIRLNPKPFCGINLRPLGGRPDRFSHFQ